MEVFIKVYIKSEDDLPKEVGDYIVKLDDDSVRLLHFPFDGDVGYNIFKTNWIEDVDWYLKPVEIPEISDEDIEEWIIDVEIDDEERYSGLDYMRLACNWYREEQRKRMNY